MNYYPFHVGDYAKHTKHLTLMGDLAYRRLLDLYYMSQRPLPVDPAECARKIGMREYLQDVSEVLSDFFLISEDGHHSKRCDEEIADYQAKALRANMANMKRWEKKKSEVGLKSDVKSDLKSESDQIPTRTINQNQNHKEEDKPSSLPAVRSKPKKSLPADFLPNDAGHAAAVAKGLDVQREFDRFCDWHTAKGSTMADWQAAWRTWVGNARPATRQAEAESFAERDARRARERFEEATGQRSGESRNVIDITPITAVRIS